tara:strand:+ start:148 stop:372 length:225 start_codon:yes stop_codon:yes gene_type:complete
MYYKSYIGVKVPASSIKDLEWKDIKRPCGMSKIIYMAPSYPREKTIVELQMSLKDDEIFLIFNPDDTLKLIGRR